MRRISHIVRHKALADARQSIVAGAYRISLSTIVVGLLTFGLVGRTYGLDLDKIKIYILEGDYKSAIIEGEKIMAEAQYSPELDELYYLLGITYLKDDNYLRASDIFEIIIKEFPGSKFEEEAQIGLGDAYFLMQEYDKAIENYQKLIRHNDQSKFKPQAYYRISLSAAKLGNTQEAKQYLERLNQEYPFNIETALQKDLAGRGEFYYTIQVGAFSNAENAKNLIQELIQKGYPAYIEEMESQGKVSWRVRVGRLRLRSEIIELENKLSQEGYPTKIYP